MISSFLNRAWNNAWLLLFLCIFFWSSNVIIARLAPGEVSPMVLGGMRWGVACMIMVPLVWRGLAAESHIIRSHWLYIVLGSCAGFSFYSFLFYAAGNFTTGVNISMLVSTVPIYTVAIAWLFLGMRSGPVVLIAVVLTVSGALTVATRGDWSVLRTLNFNIGDVMIMFASIMHAAYTVSLRNRPPLSPFVFFTIMSLVALAVSVPVVATEMAMGQTFWPTWKGWLLMIYAGTFPTIISQTFYMRGVELIGPQHTSLFYNLVPVMGALMSVSLLGEPFALYHAAAFALVLGGIALAEFSRSRTG